MDSAYTMGRYVQGNPMSQWPFPTTRPLEIQQNSPTTESKRVPSTTSNTTCDTTTGRSTASTAATMQALGIRIWPPGLQPPNCLLNGRPKIMSGQLYSSFNPTSYPSASTSTSWPSNNMFMPQPYLSSADVEVARNLLDLNHFDSTTNNHKAQEDELLDFWNLGADLGLLSPHNLVPTEESLINVGGLKQQNSEPDPGFFLTEDMSFSRHLSESPFSLSSNGGASATDITDMTPYLDALSHVPDNTSRSPMALSSTALSRAPSPRYTLPRGRSRARSRSKASSSPRSTVRSAPYSFDGAKKRWLTTPHVSSSATYSDIRFVSHNQPESSRQVQTNFINVSPPTVPSSTTLSPSTSVLKSSHKISSSSLQQNLFFPQSKSHNPNGVVSESQAHGKFLQGTFRTLNSNVDLGGNCLDYYTNTSEAPDLFSPLQEKQSTPPMQDLSTKDLGMTPHEQELRFENDLYTPKWVRGRGNKREGWCGICKPGRWLVLKNSAFWYDKCFTHGICAATGQAFDGPKKTRRMEGNPDIWEGLCGVCGEWVALVSSKKKGTTWFRHAYKCHTHSKIRSGCKRQREDSRSRSSSDRPSTVNSCLKSTKPITSTPSLVMAADTSAPETMESVAPSTSSPVRMISHLHAISSII